MRLSLDLVLPEGFWVTLTYVLFLFPVIRGSIQDVTNEAEEQESVIHVGVNKLYRQKSKVFQLTGESGNWRGQIKTPLECGVKPGDGDFLFTGRMHFGEARLGCAPRFKDFQRMYKEAKDKGLNPCEIGPDWNPLFGWRSLFSVWPGIFPGCGKNPEHKR